MPGGVRLDFFAGAGFGPDQMGRLLAPRGWVLSDYLSGINSDLPIPEPGKEVSIFDERDHRPAIYTWLTLSDPRGWGKLGLGYFDNLGDQGTKGVWETRFGTVGAVLHPFSRIDLLFQYLVGKTQNRGANCDVSFNAFYALLSFRYQDHRLSARYDVFRIHDLD